MNILQHCKWEKKTLIKEIFMSRKLERIVDLELAKFNLNKKEFLKSNQDLSIKIQIGQLKSSNFFPGFANLNLGIF